MKDKRGRIYKDISCDFEIIKRKKKSEIKIKTRCKFKRGLRWRSRKNSQKNRIALHSNERNKGR